MTVGESRAGRVLHHRRGLGRDGGAHSQTCVQRTCVRRVIDPGLVSGAGGVRAHPSGSHAAHARRPGTERRGGGGAAASCPRADSFPRKTAVGCGSSSRAVTWTDEHRSAPLLPVPEENDSSPRKPGPVALGILGKNRRFFDSRTHVSLTYTLLSVASTRFQGGY